MNPTTTQHDLPAGDVSLGPPAASSQSNFGDSVDAIKNSKIMIIDDEPLVIRVVRRFLQTAGYERCVEVTDSRIALSRIQSENPDVVLLDIMMPEVSGLDILRSRQNASGFKFTPFIILSATSDANIKEEALKLGATEFLNKPVNSSDLILRVRNALLVKAHQDHLANNAIELERQVQARTYELRRSREQVIQCLAKAAEYRDNETGMHVIRVGKYAAVIAHQLGFSREYCQQIMSAAQLHDVGKIGVPDSILLSPGKLSDKQFNMMKLHCELGCKIIEPIIDDTDAFGSGPSPLLKMASNIALTHHEKWNGTGYPRGLKGEQIPVEGRITAVADVFDALSSARPYKEPFPLEKCYEILEAERNVQFDPRVLDAFLSRRVDMEKIRTLHADEDVQIRNFRGLSMIE